ncbi:MAG: hypothetical protein K2H90_01385 [Oscillospiraceae bacterium]|nr:hypothetical protein [Oscillospiraceae bacterium]
MTKAEFTELISDSATVPNDREYRIIEFVYIWHPSISENIREGKKQIASLYSEFGMRIIADMFSTAKEAKIIEDKIAAAKDSITDYEQELEELSWGPYNLEV